MNEIRIWDYDEVHNRPHDEVVRQSDELVAAMRKLLFGKHPGVQMLALAEMCGQWVINHPHPKHRARSAKLLHQAIDEYVEFCKRKEQQK
jgi:hypothetical protein